jgi:MYXO-CTERM domain-containing protein
VLFVVTAAVLLFWTSADARAQLYRFPTSLDDYSEFYVTSYFDHGGITDWNCGGNSYTNHRGSDYGVGGFPGMAAGMDVVAAADGVVIQVHDGEADQCTTGDCPGGNGYGNHVYVEHADGKVTRYAHFKIWTVAVAVNDVVACGDKLGEVGSSGYSTGPHIHFEVRNTSNTAVDPFHGNCSSGASLWVNQGPYNGVPDPTCETSVCGDGFCAADEDHQSCPQDCPICEPVPPMGRIVDETEVCFETGGDPQWWNTENAGWSNSLTWTHTVDTSVDNYGVWNLTFDEAGQYRLEAYTAAPWAQSQQAVYQIRHSGTVDPVTVDQSAVDGWNLIGTFEFAQGGDQWIRLEDLTGEPYSTLTQIVFDAIQITRVDPQPDAGVPPVDSGTQPDSSVPSADSGTNPGADAEADVDADTDTTPPGPAAGGCNCRSHGTGGSGALLLLLLAVLTLWRRRRRWKRPVL